MYENKVSARQLRRMIFIETFGAGALSIPAFACYKEQNGFWSLIFYGVFLAGTIAFFIIFSIYVYTFLPHASRMIYVNIFLPVVKMDIDQD